MQRPLTPVTLEALTEHCETRGRLAVAADAELSLSTLARALRGERLHAATVRALEAFTSAHTAHEVPRAA
jgi:hypothetical protein